MQDSSQPNDKMNDGKPPQKNQNQKMYLQAYTLRKIYKKSSKDWSVGYRTSTRAIRTPQSTKVYNVGRRKTAPLGLGVIWLAAGASAGDVGGAGGEATTGAIAGAAEGTGVDVDVGAAVMGEGAAAVGVGVGEAVAGVGARTGLMLGARVGAVVVAGTGTGAAETGTGAGAGIGAGVGAAGGAEARPTGIRTALISYRL
jgi:hypothetical protein